MTLHASTWRLTSGSVPCALLLALLVPGELPALGAALQAPPGSPQGRAELEFDLPSWDWYGTPMRVEVWSLTSNPDRYHRKAVVTVGYVDPLDANYVSLREGVASVVLIPINEDVHASMRPFRGRRVEVTGVVRSRFCSEVDCPDLPPRPDLTAGREHWPRVSVTFWEVVDASERASRDEGGSAAALLRSIAENPTDHVGDEVTVLGQFRGHNLFGDLPARTWGRDDDWVLKAGDRAVWVTGRKPSGKGWSLDLRYEPDSRFWLEVRGEVVVLGEVACLKARTVALAKPPPGR